MRLATGTVVLLALVLVGCGATRDDGLVAGDLPAAGPLPGGLAVFLAPGQLIYEHDCARCHGEDGDDIRPTPLFDPSFMKFREREELRDGVERGRDGMPGYGGLLDDRLIDSVFAYLDSEAGLPVAISAAALLPPREPFCSACHGANGDDFPPGSGVAVYLSVCISCHGGDGAGVEQAPLFDPSFLERLGDERALTALAVAGAASSNVGHTQLDAREARDVLGYLNEQAGRDSPTVRAGQGEPLYGAHCAGCHGEVGNQIPAAPLDALGFVASRTDAQLRSAILDGTGAMRGFGRAAGGPLTDAEGEDLVAYVRQHATDLAIRNIAYGAELFVNACARCHGLDGDGVPSVRLGSPEDLRARSDAELTAAILRDTDGGRTLSAAATRGSLTRQTAALLAFLKASAGLEATAALPPATSGAAGAALFEENCAPCHGSGGNNVPNVQLKSPVFLALRSRQIVATTIRSGNDLGMPAWSRAAGGPLTDVQIEQVVDYLFETAGVETSIEAGADVGPQLYSTLCAGCHGVDRGGGVATALLPESLVRSDAYYERIIADGAGSMPGWLAQGLTGDEVAALVAYLRTEPVAVGMSAFVSAGFGAGLSGAALFEVTCQQCHGERGLNVPQCPLGSSEWLDNMQPGELHRRIGRGKPDFGMPAWSTEQGGPLSPDQIASIEAYILERFR